MDQGSKFVVAMVANATMFSYLLPGFFCAGCLDKQQWSTCVILRGYNVSNMVGGSRQRDNFPGMHCEKCCVGVVEIQFISIFSLRNTKKLMYNFATKKLVLLPGLELGSKFATTNKIYFQACMDAHGQRWNLRKIHKFQHPKSGSH